MKKFKVFLQIIDNLCSFSHRVFIRLDLSIFKIIKSSKPPILNEYMIVDSSDTIANRFKSKCKKLSYIPHYTSEFGYTTFDYLSTIFYNNFLISKKHILFYSFKINLFKN